MKTINLNHFIQEATEAHRGAAGQAREIWSVLIDLAQAIQMDLKEDKDEQS